MYKKWENNKVKRWRTKWTSLDTSSQGFSGDLIPDGIVPTTITVVMAIGQNMTMVIIMTITVMTIMMVAMGGMAIGQNMEATTNIMAIAIIKRNEVPWQSAFDKA